MAKRDKNKGPRPAEIVIAAVLSLLLGVVGAVAFLALQDPEEVREAPDDEDRVLGKVYYQPGNPGSAIHGTWQAKKQALQRGRSGNLKLVEEELNQWAGQEYESPAEGNDEDAPVLHVRPGTPRFRIEEGQFHIGIPLEWSVFGASREFPSQTWGTFTEQDGIHIYEQERVYIGSCPVPNAFGLADYVVSKVVASFDVPDELREGWAALEEVSVDDDALRLVIP